jgi:flavin reductase (DIM6/NTAB) family NADH-FMN oxidoreductase RutF
MYYETDRNDHGFRYDPLKACIVPRPIGWITSISPAGVVNLAPFSFFNIVSSDPAFVLFSAGMHDRDRGKKDTVANIEATGEFVHNMATWAQRDAMNRTSLILERGVDELQAVGLEPLPSRLVKPPRVKGSPVHFECRLHDIVQLPGRKAGGDYHLVIGRIVAVHIDDDALTPDGRIDVLKVRPIARLGYRDYSSIESTFEMEKPLREAQP